MRAPLPSPPFFLERFAGQTRLRADDGADEERLRRGQLCAAAGQSVKPPSVAGKPRAPMSADFFPPSLGVHERG